MALGVHRNFKDEYLICDRRITFSFIYLHSKLDKALGVHYNFSDEYKICDNRITFSCIYLDCIYLPLIEIFQTGCFYVCICV